MAINKQYLRHIPTIVLIIFLVLFPLALKNRYYIGVMRNVGINAIIVMGLNLLMGYAGQISLGHAAFFGLGAYCSGLLNVKLANLGLSSWMFSPWLTSIAAVIFTAGVAYLVGIPTLKLKGHYLAMATLGFGEVVYVVLNKLDWLTGDTSGLLGIKPYTIWGLKFSSRFAIGQYWLTWTLALAVLIVSLNITNSRVGRAFRAIHGSEMAAKGMGVDITKYKVQVFVLSAIFAAIAGCLHAHFTRFIGYPSFHLQTSIKFVTMVVIGGLANIWGAILGALLLTWLPEWLIWLPKHLKGLPKWMIVVIEHDIMIYGVLLMLVMIFMPDGIVGGSTRLVKRIISWISPDVQTKEIK